MPPEAPELELSRDEIVRLLEEKASARTGMNAKKLLRLYREGKVPDPGEIADILVLADLLAKNDPIFAAA